jgi:hypothetical protein
MDQQSPSAKMWHHIKQAEKWQEEIDAMEAVAEVRAKRKMRNAYARSKMTEADLKNPAIVLYYTKVELENDGVYKSAVANRNGHQAQAQMYGTAALVNQAVPTTKNVQCDDANAGISHRPHQWRGVATSNLYFCAGAYVSE